MRAALAIFAVCVLALATWAYTKSQPPKEDVAVITINAEMSKQSIPILVTKGSTFTIDLASNATTGYSWSLGNDYNSKVIKKTVSVYNSPDSLTPAQAMVGRGGSETWTFYAIGKGKTGITLKYARRWEKDVPPAKTQTFAITVR